MKITVTNSEMVKQATTKPINTTLWISNLDAIMPPNHHTQTLYFYRFTGSPNFFDTTLLKGALSRALLDFYPIAGRLKKDQNGRIEIDCNGRGVLFVEADANADMDELADFGPKPELGLIPTVDYSHGIDTYPLCLFQVTRFKCGGVCLGSAIEHRVLDGSSAVHFINTWSDIARGLDNSLITPFTDRTILRARSPPNPRFPHIEYHPRPQMKTEQRLNPSETTTTTTTKYSRLKQTRDQINALKAKCNRDRGGDELRCTTYEALAGHIWRCVCMARGLPGGQKTMMHISVDGRNRLKPPLPQGYFGNAVFSAAPVASCGDLQSSPLSFAARKVHDALARMDDEYMRSALDYLEAVPDLRDVARGPHTYKCPNLGIISWVRLPFYDADFGWGKPAYVGPGARTSEGKCHMLRSSEDDGSVVCAITLPEDQMEVFEKLFYDDI